MFTSCQNCGFQITFANGWTISVQFGSGNYCVRRSSTAAYQAEMEQPIVQSEDAEIAIWDANNNWYDFGSDTVKGWVSADEVAEWINKVSKF